MRGCKFGCVCSYMAGHEDSWVVTGHIGTNTPKFVPPRWGRPPFDPTQTGCCANSVVGVWSSLRYTQKMTKNAIELWEHFRGRPANQTNRKGLIRETVRENGVLFWIPSVFSLGNNEDLQELVIFMKLGDSCELSFFFQDKHTEFQQKSYFFISRPANRPFLGLACRNSCWSSHA